MTVTVEEVVADTFTSTAAAQSAVLATTPLAGDVVVMAGTCTSATIRTVTAVSGLGATWSRVYDGAQTEYWIGVGATAAGTVSVTFSAATSSAGNHVALYLVRGLPATTSVGAEYAVRPDGAGTGVVTGPTVGAGPGQLVISTTTTRSGATSSLGSVQVQVPSAGWSTPTIASANGSRHSIVGTYRAPTEYGTHRIDVATAGPLAQQISTTTLVFGTYAGDQAMGMAAVLRRKNDFGNKLRRITRFKLFSPRAGWQAAALSLEPVSFLPLEEPDQAQRYVDYAATHDPTNWGENTGQGTRVASLIPGDPDGAGVAYGWSDWWPTIVAEWPAGALTRMFTFKSTPMTALDDYLDLFDDGLIYVGVYPAVNQWSYESEVQFNDGPYISIPSFNLEDIVDDQEHLLAVMVDATTLTLWVDGVTVVAVPHGGTYPDPTYLPSLNPFDHSSNTATVTIDDPITFGRVLQAPELSFIWSAWLGEEVEQVSWEMSLAGVLQRKTLSGSFSADLDPQGTIRWALIDDTVPETWVMPINPDSMSSPVMKRRQLTFGNGYRADGRVRTFERPAPAMEWEWSGVIRTKEHYDQLVHWAEKSVAVVVQDHLNRVFRVYITDFLPTDRSPTYRTSWRMRYQMKARILERVQ